MKKLIFLSVFAVILTLSCSGRNSGNQAPQGGFNFAGMQRATTVEVAEVTEQSISQILRSFGTVRTQDNVRVTPQISERISSIHADLGDTVAQGQLLARLRDVNFVDQVRRDEAQLQQAQTAVNRDSLELSRATSLFERNLISSAELENVRVAYLNSRANLQAARAALTQSRESLNFTEVRSPVRGVVTRRSVSPGDLANSGSPAFEIANLVGYEMRIFQPLADRRLTRVGQPVSIRLTGERNPSANGIVSRISPELDPVTGLAEVVISLTEVFGDILPGSLAEASITVRTNPSSVVIPRSALVENVQTVLDPESNTIRLNRTFNAFVSVGDSMVSLRTLEIGLEQGDRLEVLSGITSGERLVITGQGGLEDGSRIRVSGRGRPGMDGQRPILPGEQPASSTATTSNE